MHGNEEGKSGVPWQVLDLSSLSSDVRTFYNQMKGHYENNDEGKYLSTREKFYNAVKEEIRTSDSLASDQEVHVVFRPARVDVAIMKVKKKKKSGGVIKKGTFRIPSVGLPSAPETGEPEEEEHYEGEVLGSVHHAKTNE
jgi:hypothetical protein